MSVSVRREWGGVGDVRGTYRATHIQIDTQTNRICSWNGYDDQVTS